MNEHMVLHVEDKIQAFLDGELSRSAAEAVRAHCDRCEKCGTALADLRAVDRVLAADSDPSPIRPMWPGVREGIARHRSPRFGLPFGLATSAAAVAGVVLGVLLGAPGDLSNYEPETSDAYAEGSVLGDDSVPTLDEIYVYSFGEDGDD
jgi:anti-sigma factor RsiW